MESPEDLDHWRNTDPEPTAPHPGTLPAVLELFAADYAERDKRDTEELAKNLVRRLQKRHTTRFRSGKRPPVIGWIVTLGMALSLLSIYYFGGRIEVTVTSTPTEVKITLTQTDQPPVEIKFDPTLPESQPTLNFWWPSTKTPEPPKKTSTPTPKNIRSPTNTDKPRKTEKPPPRKTPKPTKTKGG